MKRPRWVSPDCHILLRVPSSSVSDLEPFESYFRVGERSVVGDLSSLNFAPVDRLLYVTGEIREDWILARVLGAPPHPALEGGVVNACPLTGCLLPCAHSERAHDGSRNLLVELHRSTHRPRGRGDGPPWCVLALLAHVLNPRFHNTFLYGFIGRAQTTIPCAFCRRSGGAGRQWEQAILETLSSEARDGNHRMLLGRRQP